MSRDPEKSISGRMCLIRELKMGIRNDMDKLMVIRRIQEDGNMNGINWGDETLRTLDSIRKRKPLIHNLTNFVVMNFTANVILSIGASPVMAHAREEVEEMAGYAGAVVLNIGTLEPAWVHAMILAGKSANSKGIPVIFDPVGVGATRYRSQAARDIMGAVKIDIIRGNAAEISALAGFEAKIRGVDSLNSVDEASSIIREASRRLNSVVAMTGVEDLVCDRDRCYAVSGGDAMFTRVTGTGCAASVACACFAAVEPDPVNAAIYALAYYGVAGTESASRSAGPGSFAIHLLDALAGLDRNTVRTSVLVREVME